MDEVDGDFGKIILEQIGNKWVECIAFGEHIDTCFISLKLTKYLMF